MINIAVKQVWKKKHFGIKYVSLRGISQNLILCCCAMCFLWMWIKLTGGRQKNQPLISRRSVLARKTTTVTVHPSTVLMLEDRKKQK